MYIASEKNSAVYLLLVQVKYPNFTSYFFSDGTLTEISFDYSIFP